MIILIGGTSNNVRKNPPVFKAFERLYHQDVSGSIIESLGQNHNAVFLNVKRITLVEEGEFHMMLSFL